MLSEDRARDLLQQAAATVAVPPGDPVIGAPRRRWIVPVAVAAAVAGVVALPVLVLGGQGEPAPSPPVGTNQVHPSGPTVDALDVCPEKLGEWDGFTMTEPPGSDERPLPDPDFAWACSYSLTFGDPDKPNRSEWVRDSGAEATGADLDFIRELLAALRLQGSTSTICPADLGPVYLLVVESGGERFGLTWADYGCRIIGLGPTTSGVSYEAREGLGRPPGFEILCLVSGGTEQDCR